VIARARATLTAGRTDCLFGIRHGVWAQPFKQYITSRMRAGSVRSRRSPRAIGSDGRRGVLGAVSQVDRPDAGKLFGRCSTLSGRCLAAMLGWTVPGQALLQADMTELICSARLPEDAAGRVGVLKE
jgi:hypothetical protein